MSRICAALLIASLSSLSAVPAAADAPTHWPSQASVLESLGDKLDQYYLDRGVASAYRRALNEFARSGRANGLAGEELAKALTASLQKSHADAHLAVYAPGKGIFGKEDESGEPPLPEN